MIQPKIDEISQLRAQVAALEQQLAARELEVKRLLADSQEWLDMLSRWVKRKLYDQDSLTAFCQMWDKALSTPTTTAALDAYVEEKIANNKGEVN